MKQLTSTFTIECWGCGKTSVHDYSGYDSFEWEIEHLISSQGWIRRSFGPNASSWFCSPHCAYSSHAALQAEEWWKKHNQSKDITPFTAGIIGSVMFIVLLAIGCFVYYLGG